MCFSPQKTVSPSKPNQDLKFFLVFYYHIPSATHSVWLGVDANEIVTEWQSVHMWMYKWTDGWWLFGYLYLGREEHFPDNHRGFHI